MTITPAVLQPGSQLGTSASVLYTVPTNTKAIVKRAVFTNIGATAVKLTVYRVPSGALPAAGNTVIAAYTLSIGQAYVAPELGNMVLGAGESIEALSDTPSSVNAFISGFTA